jgi:hypothetical protein
MEANGNAQPAKLNKTARPHGGDLRGPSQGSRGQCLCACQFDLHDLSDKQVTVTNVRFGSKADIAACPHDVRFTPEGRHLQCTRACPLCANSEHSCFNSSDCFCYKPSTMNDRDFVAFMRIAVVCFILS